MRRFIPALVIMALILISCSKDATGELQETPVNKRIEFNVFTQKDYSDAFYDQAFAEVRLSISKTNLKNNTTTLVWDTVYNFRQFRQYPQIDQKINIEKNVQHYESSETLDVSTIVRYNFNGYQSMEAKGDPVLRNENYKLATVSF